MNLITKTLFKSTYSGSIPPAPFKQSFKHGLKSFEFLLDLGAHTPRELAYLIRDFYSLENDQTRAVVAALEAESIWEDYQNGNPLPAFAPHSPHVTDTSTKDRIEFTVKSPLCSCFCKFSVKMSQLETMHAELHRNYWTMLNHMQTDCPDLPS